VLLDGDRLTLLDFDLFTRGDPALDVGNFLGHLIEQALRRYGDPARLRDREEALEEAYLARATRVERASLGAWATLTLARHIHISRSIPDRSHLTSDLLELCEERLGIRSSSAA
jgi:aminoglycoside phosphotransferase (APT) family kinase protein